MTSQGDTWRGGRGYPRTGSPYHVPAHSRMRTAWTRCCIRPGPARCEATAP